jgi:DNA-binding transcriptional LysR family regulator
MKISLEALITLEAIEKYGSFAQAAKALHRVPSALTYTINTLETQLHIQIFDRSGHKAILTPVGRLLLEEGTKLIQNASQLEKAIQLQQSGWEAELLMVYDRIIPFKNLLFLLEAFYEECPGVELKLSGEVLGGCWDALLSGRATVAIGVTGDSPIRDDMAQKPLGTVDFEFVVGANHPLSKVKGALSNSDIVQYRSIAVADSANVITRRTTGVLPSQKILTVSNFEEKIAALIAGLGVGYLPTGLAKSYIAKRQLVAKEVQRLKTRGTVGLAWRPSMAGKGAKWFIEKLSEPEIIKKLLKS